MTGEETWQSIDLRGTVDIHIHAAPDVKRRRGDDLDMARDATEAGMRAIVLKSHHTSTVERAYLCQRVLGVTTRVFGGAVLNPAVGGLNPVAVEVALKLGARVIWMPTVGARNHRRREGKAGGITIFDESGMILGVVIEIVDMVAAAGALLSSGHLAPEETLALARLARERGLERFAVTHPELRLVDMDVDVQREIASLGGFFERDFLSTTHHGQHRPLERYAQDLQAVGVESTVLATDLGQFDTPPPVEGMRRYLAGLRALGFSDEQLHTMAARNPAYLLGLDCLGTGIHGADPSAQLA